MQSLHRCVGHTACQAGPKNSRGDTVQAPPDTIQTLFSVQAPPEMGVFTHDRTGRKKVSWPNLSFCQCIWY